MTYSVVFGTRAEKHLLKLPLESRERILAALNRCRIRPYSHVLRLVGSPYYRLRVGNYRIILDIKDQQLAILVIDVGPRERIYKR